MLAWTEDLTNNVAKKDATNAAKKLKVEESNGAARNTVARVRREW